MTIQNNIMELNHKNKYHFIGVGGIGMSGLAELLGRQGMAGALKDRRRGELLAELMKNHPQVAVTGMHGKTSTTAMTAAVLRAGGLDPTVVVGSVWDGVGSNAVLGRGGVFVAESDESDGSFALVSPEITIITNLDREHLDYYRDLAHVQEMFAAYLQRLPEGARVIACADDPHLAPGSPNCPPGR